MSKFKVIETKQKVQEVTKAEKVGTGISTALRGLIDLGTALGGRMGFMSTVGNLLKTLKPILKYIPFIRNFVTRTKEYTEDQKKVIEVLKADPKYPSAANEGV